MKYQLTNKDLEEINKMSSLVELCKEVIKVSRYGVNKEYCLEIIENLTPLFKKHCPELKLVKTN